MNFNPAILKEMSTPQLKRLEQILATLSNQSDPAAFDAVIERLRAGDAAAFDTDAAKEAPELFDQDYRRKPKADDEDEDFDELVETETRKGLAPAVARQRVAALHPDAASAIAKRADLSVVQFMAEVDSTMIAKRCSRTAAMSAVRLRDPALYQKYQEV
jgi:hypothetical protein